MVVVVVVVPLISHSKRLCFGLVEPPFLPLHQQHSYDVSDISLFSVVVSNYFADLSSLSFHFY